MAALAPTQPVFNFVGYGRNKLENQIEEVEEEWQNERVQRIELQRLLKIEQNAHNAIHWELRETKNQLEKELKAHHELKRNWETSRTTYETTLENEKQLKREKKEFKKRILDFQEDIKKLDLEIKKSKEVENKLNSQIDLLRQENAVEEEHDISYKQREIDRTYEKVRDLEKKWKKLKEVLILRGGDTKTVKLRLGMTSRGYRLKEKRHSLIWKPLKKKLRRKINN